jgi:hypothetical protein
MPAGPLSNQNQLNRMAGLAHELLEKSQPVRGSAALLAI